MRLANHTPFPALAFESLAPDGLVFITLVLKATFDILADGTLRLSPEQTPLALSDEHYGDPLASSVRVESDLAPFKPRADILFIDPVALAPGGRPARSWTVSVRVGSLRHELRVTGPRRWVRGVFRRWSLTDPEPATEVAVRHELAYGGQWREGDAGDACQENPVGTGVIGPAERRDGFPGPQVEDPQSPVRGANRTDTRPTGLTPVGRGWLPRRMLAGTFDQRWLDEQWPKLPKDFRYRHHNAATEALQYEGYLIGGEPFVIEGLFPAGRISFSTPPLNLLTVAGRRDGSFSTHPCRIDTAIIDATGGRVSFLARSVFAAAPDVGRVEVGASPKRGSHG